MIFQFIQSKNLTISDVIFQIKWIACNEVFFLQCVPSMWRKENVSLSWKFDDAWEQHIWTQTLTRTHIQMLSVSLKMKWSNTLWTEHDLMVLIYWTNCQNRNLFGWGLIWHACHTLTNMNRRLFARSRQKLYLFVQRLLFK